MLFLSSGTVDGSPRSAAISQQHQGKTVYHISVVLKETQGDALLPELEMGLVAHALVEERQPGGEVMSVVPMEKSPRQGRTRLELNRWPSLPSTGRRKEKRDEVVVEENEEELEEVEGKMKTDGFLKQPSKNSGNSSQQGRDVAEAADTQKHHTRSSSLRAVTFQAKGLVYGEPGPGAGHGSLSRAVLRRPRHNETRLARKTLSMYGDSVKQGRDSQPDQERRLRRPRSVCMLAGPGPGPVLLESHSQSSFKRGDISENDRQYRSRKAELRAVDGLNPGLVQRPPVPAEVTARVRQKGWRPRPVSMTVLELRKRGSDDEIDSQRSCNQSSGDGGFLKGGFRWKLFGKAPQDKNRERDWDKDVKSSSKVGKSDAPKSTLSSLRRSISLRIRRSRPREKVNLGSEAQSQEHFRTNSVSEESAMPPRPFSYLTGRMLPTPSEQTEDGGVQYIQYHSKGKVKVMEVPHCPTKLSSKPVQEEQSIWQLIASRFRRKEQPVNGKCETQLSHGNSTGQCPPTGNNKSHSVSIVNLSGADSHKGQGKTCNIAEFIYFLCCRFTFASAFHQKKSCSTRETLDVLG